MVTLFEYISLPFADGRPGMGYATTHGKYRQSVAGQLGTNYPYKDDSEMLDDLLDISGSLGYDNIDAFAAKVDNAHLQGDPTYAPYKTDPRHFAGNDLRFEGIGRSVQRNDMSMTTPSDGTRMYKRSRSPVADNDDGESGSTVGKGGHGPTVGGTAPTVYKTRPSRTYGTLRGTSKRPHSLPGFNEPDPPLRLMDLILPDDQALQNAERSVDNALNDELENEEEIESNNI